jgi:hypothetical protein
MMGFAAWWAFWSVHLSAHVDVCIGLEKCVSTRSWSLHVLVGLIAFFAGAFSSFTLSIFPCLSDFSFNHSLALGLLESSPRSLAWLQEQIGAIVYRHCVCCHVNLVVRGA